MSNRINPAAYARDGLRDIGWCGPCGKKIHLSRKVAKMAARRSGAGENRPRAYECPHIDGHWHIGHIPDAVRHGEIDRDLYRQSRERAR